MVINKKEITIKRKYRDNKWAYIFLAPSIIGLLMFTIYPVLSSLVYSFQEYNFFSEPKFIGLKNYIDAFTAPGKSTLFYKSLQNTFIYLVWSIVVGMPITFVLALLLNQDLKGIKAFRIIYYLPVIMPSIVGGFVSKNLYNENYGYLNTLLGYVGLGPYPFFSRAETSMPSYLFSTLFGLGANMIMWLAALKSVPSSLYEAAEIDGAGRFVKLTRITLPLSTPYILYVLIVSIIGALQIFGPFVMLNGTGGVDNSLLFYTMNLYMRAFYDFEIGYAAALSWILFLITGILAFISFKTSKWVHYLGD